MQYSESARVNPIALLAALVGMLALGNVPFLQPQWFLFKANRLVEGISYDASLVGSNAESMLLLWCVLLVIALLPLPARPWLLAAVAAVVLALTFFTLQTGVEILTADLQGRALRSSRISLRGAVWLNLLAVYIAIFAAFHESRASSWQKMLLAVPSLLVTVIFIANGSMAGLGLSRELSSQTANVNLELVRHMALTLTSVLLAALIGIPAAIGAARQPWLERTVLPSAAILQTLPSLALFGLMLAPLATLGNRLQGWQALLFILASALLCYVLWWKAKASPYRVAAIALLLPAAVLLVILLAIFLNAAFVALGTGDFASITPFANFLEQPLNHVGVRGIGSAPALIALTLYALLPIVRNTYTGIKEVPRAAIEAGKGMGMHTRQILRQIELPLALPLIIEGLRASLVLTIGIATVSFLIGAGGLGVFIQRGIDQVVPDLILLGVIPIIVLALVADGLLRALGLWLTPKGVRA